MKKASEEFTLNTIEDTQKAIQILHKRIEFREIDLQNRLNQIPKESFKVAAKFILPTYLNTKISCSSWSIFKDLFELISPIGSNKSRLFFDIVRQVGVISVLKKVVSYFTIHRS